MKYYKLVESININEIGIYPQVTNTEKFFDTQEFGLGFNERIEKEFILPVPIMENKAKVTSIISVTAIDNSVFLVLKNYFIDFLKKFKIGDFQFWNIDVYHKKQLIKDYYLFHLSYPSQKEVIDFEKSKFKIKDNTNIILEQKKYTDYHGYQTDWKKLIWEGSVITFDTLYLDFSSANLDLIRIIDIDSIGIGYYVSERLKNAIEKEKFTGFAFQEIEEMDKRIKVIF
ncbi:MAG: hypothetical protein Q4G27_05325 [Flavobacteriaceae bacterium]|nr:hypothetical protein [Flavobacteriaceae bacterium]